MTKETTIEISVDDYILLCEKVRKYIVEIENNQDKLCEWLKNNESPYDKKGLFRKKRKYTWFEMYVDYFQFSFGSLESWVNMMKDEGHEFPYSDKIHLRRFRMANENLTFSNKLIDQYGKKVNISAKLLENIEDLFEYMEG